MPNYISKINFGDGIERKVRVQSSGGGITDFAEIPTVEETEFDYDGTQKELVFTDLDTEKVTVSGASATEAGTYTCTLTLKSNSYAWKDLSQEPILIEWEILNTMDRIYGVNWDKSSSPLLTRTDDAQNFENPNPYYPGMNTTPSSPFDNIMPWSGMQIVEDADAGTLVSIPKFYYKWTISSTSMQLQISMIQHEGFKVSPAHMDRGDGKGERDVVYIGRYPCATSTYKSTTGVQAQVDIKRSSFRASIHSIGSDVWQNDFAIFWTIRMLYLVEYANWNSQEVIGGAIGTTYEHTTGLTDAMPYHTGKISDSGYIQYRYIESIWGSVREFCDGITFSTSDNYVRLWVNPDSFRDSTPSNAYKLCVKGTSAQFFKGWKTALSGATFDTDWALFPDGKGAANTYICDYYAHSSSGQCAVIKGASQYQLGMFSIGCQFSSTGTADNVGSRLMKLP